MDQQQEQKLLLEDDRSIDDTYYNTIANVYPNTSWAPLSSNSFDKIHSGSSNTSEQEDPLQSIQLRPVNDRTCKEKCFGYLLVATFNVSFTVAFVSAQLSVSKTDVFELNTLRFASQLLISLILLLLTKQLPLINWKHWYLVLAVAVFDLIFCTCNLFVAPFMPVGNAVAVLMATYTILTLIVDLIKKVAKKISIIAAVFACIGILFMVQPWHSGGEASSLKNNIADIPCDIMDGLNINSTYEMVYLMRSNISLKALSHDGDKITELHLTDTSYRDEYLPYYKDQQTTKQLYGYLIVIGAAISATISGNCAQQLLKYSRPTVATFWIGLVEGIMSLIITCFIKHHTGAAWTLPPVGTYCLLFTLMCTTFTAIQDLCMYFAYQFLPISQCALAITPTPVLLYISQRTMLKHYHPGKANALEVIGVVVTTFGAAISPFLNIISEKINQRK